MDRVDRNYFERFCEFEKKYDELRGLLDSVEIMTDNKLFLFYKRQFDELDEFVTKFKKLKKMIDCVSENKKILLSENDAELIYEIQKENEKLELEASVLFSKLKAEYADMKNNSDQTCRVELTFKSGEIENFVLIKNAFEKYAENGKMKFEVKKTTELSAVFEISGKNAYTELKIFSGNIRFILGNRETIILCAVILEDKGKVELFEDDVVVETLKSGGAGGQHINKTESAVRLIHKPTGITVICQDERSQTMNRERAFENLKNKLIQINNENYKKSVEKQRSKIKNIIFSNTPTMTVDLNKNILTYTKIKKDYSVRTFLDGKLNIIAGDVNFDGK